MKLISTTLSEIANNFNAKLTINFENYQKVLLNGDLYSFEKEFFNEVTGLYNDLVEAILENVSTGNEMKAKLTQYGQKRGLGGLKLRGTKLQLYTGKTITVNGYYATKQAKRSYEGTRHLIQPYWGCEKHSSPRYYSLVSMLSVVCPSFDVSNEILGQLNIECNFNRTRDLAIHIGNKCIKDRIGNCLKLGETLEGKRVTISVDGGRSRTREKTGQYNKGSNYSKYKTPWREPKLFVIHTIDSEGKMEKTVLPIYDCVLGNCESCFKLLGEYLKKLKIERAKEVQFIADGATWIWNRVLPMLSKLGVKKHAITETVDYYHAVEHLGKIVGALPSNIQKLQGANIFKKLKGHLWNGEIDNIITLVKSNCKKIGKKVLTELAYFVKNKKRMVYSKFRSDNLLCGSGIVESAIRRIINLRFKCPSSFWDENNLEGLIYLRAILLSKRWNIMIYNLNNNGYKY